MTKARVLILALIVVLIASVVVAAQSQPRNFIALMSPEEEVTTEPVVSDAHGVGTFVLSNDGQSMRFHLNVAQLENITQAHLHLGAEGQNGGIIVWLFPVDGPPRVPDPGVTVSGLLSRGSFDESNLVGPLAGADWETFVQHVRDGGVYVNVHTTAYPPGEIRGQLRTNSQFRSGR